MKTRSKTMQVGVLSVSVQAALAAMFALPMLAQAAAAADEVAALKQPTNFVEIGALNVSDKSAKFGEYNGLNKSDAYFIGNFSLRGGDAYGDGGGTMRWGLFGTDLGTTSRALGAAFGNQGLWDLAFGYDELRHNISDTYQTPLLGAGGNNLTLPAGFGTINAANSGPSARVLTAAQLAAMHTEDVQTTRKNTSFGAGFNINRQLNLRFDYNHLDQSGAKLVGTGSQGGISLVGGSTGRAEANNIILNPTSYQTDNFNLSLNWVGDKGHLSAGYYGSIFRDDYNSLSWQNALATGASTCVGVACYVTNTMSTAPDNNFNQLNVSGGYAFSPSTKLAGGVSYGRNTQNDSYASAVMQPGGLPQASLDGKVVTKHADLKLTSQMARALVVTAGLKFNERDNDTASNTYNYLNLGNAAYTGVNTPYSHKKTQFELAGDYRLAKGQNLRLAYEREQVRRWCASVVGGAQCVASPSSDEDTLALTYRLQAGDSIRFNVGYSYADRSADFDHAYAANTGSYPQVNGGDKLGYVAYPYASRKQDIVKAGVTWQVNDRLDLALSGRYSDARYDAVLGVQNGRATSVNLDATYTYSEHSSVSAYVNSQSGDRDLVVGNDGTASVAPTKIWSNQLRQDGYAIGLSTRHTGLMGGKVELVGDLSYSYDKSRYSTQVPYLATCSAANTLSCGDTPDVKNDLVSLKFTGTYHLGKSSRVALAYQYQKLKGDDYYYNGLQYGFTPNRVIPTNELAPNYTQNVVGLSYIYSFR